MADPAAPTTSRPARSGSKAPRTPSAPSTVSTETENKLARAARSAQRLAELSDVPADDGTLDLFPDDPARAALEAMNIDVRQGTLTGFELPDEVLAAVEAAAADGGDAVVVEAPVETKAVRRSARAAAHAQDAVRDAGREAAGGADETNAPLLQARADEPGNATAATADTARAKANSENDGGGARETSPVASSPVMRPSMRSSAQSSAQPSTSAGAVSSDALPMAAASTARNATALDTETKTLAASRGANSLPPNDTTDTTDTAGSTGSTGSTTEPAADATRAAPPPRQPYASSAPRTPFGASGVAGIGAAAQPSPSRATPELDHARAAAFADTVDALYGVIADQRRAAAEHSRRMKRMLSIVVGVLLVTVAIGVAQMLLLVRLAHDTTVRQQRIEQTLLGQQATFATLLQTESSSVRPSAMPAATIGSAGNAGNAPANPDVPAAAAARQPAEPHSPAKTAHARKHKSAAATATTHPR
jgi:hypothetical protein